MLRAAKSNVVNQDKQTAADPPQRSNMNNIADVTPGGTSVNVIQDVEYFARNFAALGGCNSSISLVESKRH
jgi:hypothetical protein